MAMFSKLLTEADVVKSLLIPSCSVGDVQEEGNLYMQALDNNGKAWSFTCSVHRDATAGAVLSVCWDEFVREKNVRANDQVVLKEKSEKSVAGGTIFTVDIKRKIRLFGEDIWADI